MLDKIYKDEDKFSGTGDNFNFKVTIFYNKYRQVGLPPNAYIYGTSIMLSGQVQMHFMPIMLTLLPLTNSVPICSCSLRAQMATSKPD